MVSISNQQTQPFTESVCVCVQLTEFLSGDSKLDGNTAKQEALYGKWLANVKARTSKYVILRNA